MICRAKTALANWRLLASFYAARLMMALAIAYPLARIVGASGLSAYPRGDTLLFEPGGMLLVEVLRVNAAMIGAAVRSAVVVAWLAAIVSLVPLSLCLVALGKGRRATLREVAGDAFGVLPTFVLLSGLTVLGQAVVVVLSMVLIAPLVDPLRAAWPGPYADAVLTVLFGLVALGVLAIGILNDLARAAATREHARAWPAARRAIELLASRPIRVLTGWLGPSSAAALLLLLGALAALAIDVSRAEPWRVVALAGLHQLVALGLIATRATWLVFALELTGGPTGTEFFEPDDRSEGSAGPRDPSSDPIA